MTDNLYRFQRDQYLRPGMTRYSYSQMGRLLDHLVRDELRRVEVSAPVSGEPIEDPQDDKFDFQRLSTQISDYILSPTLQTPTAICIDGHWGMGKSSLSKLVRRRLDDQVKLGVLPVWINTALITTADQVLPTIARRTLEAGDIVARRILNIPDEANLEPPPILPTAYLLSNTRTTAKDDERLEKHLKGFAAKWLDTWAQADRDHWDYDRLQLLIREMRHALLGGGVGRIVWFIDDLDRCEPDIILKTFELHRTLLEEWGVILVYSMDYNIIAAVIGENFLKDGGYLPFEVETAWQQGMMYLEKFFNLRFRPPSPLETSLKSWLQETLGADCYFQELETFLRLNYENNPRRIKHFIRVFQFLRMGFERAKTDGKRNQWTDLVSIENDKLALQVIAKMTALALASDLRPFYEEARLPSPEHLTALEVAAKNHIMVNILLPRGNRIGPAQAQIPEDLQYLLSIPPFFSDVPISALMTIILNLEYFLPAPWLLSKPTSLRIETPVEIPEKSSEAGEDRTAQQGQVIPNASVMERAKVRERVDAWRDQLPRTVELPTKLKNMLILQPGNLAVQAFRDKNWQPGVRDLVISGMNSLQGKDKQQASWLFSAALVHPEFGQEDLEALSRLVPYLEDPDFSVMVFEIGSLRLNNAPSARIALAVALFRTRRAEDTSRAVKIFLEVLKLEEKDLSSETLALQDRFSENEYTNAFLGLTDALNRLERHDENLRVIEGATLRTPSGIRESQIIRNLARSLDALKQPEEARKLYLASVALDHVEDRACYWARDVFEADKEMAMLLVKTAADRLPNDADAWYEVGVTLHNAGTHADATPWLKRALMLNPDSQDIRNAVFQNLELTSGRREAARFINAAEFDFDDKEVRNLAHSAHRELLNRILNLCPITYKGAVILDKNNSPAWIRETFPDLFG